MDSSFPLKTSERTSWPSSSSVSISSPPGTHSLTNAHSPTLLSNVYTGEYTSQGFLSPAQHASPQTAHATPPLATHNPMDMFAKQTASAERTRTSSTSNTGGADGNPLQVQNRSRDSEVNPNHHQNNNNNNSSLDSVTAASLSDSAVVTGRLERSVSDVSLPSILATVPQPPPPPPPRRRTSSMAKIAPLTPAAVEPTYTHAGCHSRDSHSPSSPALPRHGGGAFYSSSNNSGGSQLVAARSVLSPRNAAMSSTALRGGTGYPSYNVHPVLHRAAHPLFQRDVPSRLGRHTASPSISAFFPLTVSAGKLIAAAPSATSMPSSGAVVAAAAAAGAYAESTPRRGFRFPHPPSPPRPRTPAGASGSALRQAIQSSSKHPGEDLVEMLSSSHSLVGAACVPFTEQQQQQQRNQQPHFGTPPSVKTTCLTPSLEPDTASVAPPPFKLTPGVAACAEASQLHNKHYHSADSPHPRLRVSNSSTSSSSSPSQGTPCLTCANTWSTSRQSPSSVMGGGVSLTSSTNLPCTPLRAAVKLPQQPLELHLAVPLVTPTTPSTRVQPRVRVYSRGDIRRGRWIINIVREECVARAALEEEATYEAIRTLPASCRVWKTYIDPVYNDEYDALGYYLLRRGAQNGANMPFASDEVEDGEGDEDLRRTLAAHHTRVAELKAAATPHPALLAGAQRLTLMEEVCRADIVSTEANAFCEHICSPYVYEHRIMTVGTLPLERFLRRWVGHFRSRNAVHTRQRARLCKLERDAREGLLRTSHTLAARHACMLTALVVEEQHYRTQVELLSTQDAAWTGVVLLRLREQVELFSLLFGGTMRQTRVCGRVEGMTLFRSLTLTEQATRGAVEAEEEREWRCIPSTMQLRFTSVCAEPQARAALVQEEAARRLELTQVIYALTVHYTKHDVELQEYDERQTFVRCAARTASELGGGTVWQIKGR